MKLLVTGGAGYIGSIVTALLLDAGHEVVVLDDLSTGHAEAVPAGAQFVRGRVHDAVAGLLTPAAGFDGVLHFAAFIAAGESVQRPEKYWENNLVGSLRLLDAMRAAGVRRLVFSSTANVYGDPDETPIPETAATRPPNPYAGSKLAVDHDLLTCLQTAADHRVAELRSLDVDLADLGHVAVLDDEDVGALRPKLHGGGRH